MIYQFENEEIEACGDCPCCDSIGGCALGGSVESLGEVPDDCPLVAISKTETTGCEWCKKPNATMAGSIGTVHMSKANYCPNCGRRLEETI